MSNQSEWTKGKTGKVTNSDLQPSLYGYPVTFEKAVSNEVGRFRVHGHVVKGFFEDIEFTAITPDPK